VPACVWYSVGLRGEMESIYLYMCLFVSLSAYPFFVVVLIVVFLKRGRDGGAVTFDVKGDRDE